MSDQIIQIRDVNKWFGDFQVLKNINLEVEKNKKIVVCGPSGSGKSTLIRCINRLEEHQEGQIIEGHSISAGLDYPGIGPEHAWLNDLGRVKYVSVTDSEALDAFKLCCKLEGIIPALEPSHALAHVMKIAPTLPKDKLILLNMCGRGDKDIFTVAERLDVSLVS